MHDTDVERLLVLVALDSSTQVISETHARVLLLLVSWVCTVTDMAKARYIQTARQRAAQSVQGDERHICCVCSHSNFLCHFISLARPQLKACPEHVGALGHVEEDASIKLMTRLSAREVVGLTETRARQAQKHPTSPAPPGQ
mmetsp:Transcript_88275/g.129081  ORF Transcript_88275/g.129081 Transcript_88275/m.129081 type:complete len:142 (-) Transcript_88275:56-481(-)